jgi:hypothetical protein
MTWNAPTTHDEVCRRAAGRRAYNSWRQTIAVIRRVEVRRLLATRYTAGRRGTVRGIARELGVDPATICRDIKAILREMKPCSQCGKLGTPACCGGADVPPVDVTRPPCGWTARGPRPRSDLACCTEAGAAKPTSRRSSSGGDTALVDETLSSCQADGLWAARGPMPCRAEP